MSNVDTKRIRFVDLSELEVYNIVESGDSLQIQFKNATISDSIAKFKDSTNCGILQYYVGLVLTKAYTGYIVYVSAVENANVLISTDYATVDTTTESGFAEVRADIQTITIRKKTDSERISKLEEKVGV